MINLKRKERIKCFSYWFTFKIWCLASVRTIKRGVREANFGTFSPSLPHFHHGKLLSPVGWPRFIGLGEPVPMAATCQPT